MIPTTTSLHLSRLRILTISGILACAALCPADARAEGLFALGNVGLGDELTTMRMSPADTKFVLVGNTRGQIYRTADGGATWQVVTITPVRTLFFGRERSSDPRLEYALGLPGKSPHLQSWLRRQGLATSGINLQQLLVNKGDKMTAVNWIEIDPTNDSRVFVATVDGLYRSIDRGRTFQRIFQGQKSMAERMVNTVAVDPHDPRRVLIGTASGLFVSKNNGTYFRKTMNYYMRDSYIREIHFDPEQPGLVHVAMGGSAMASLDGGDSWITTHWDEWGPRADVQSFSMGPGNVRLIGTRDGLYASWQGGEMGTWVRRGIRFVGTAMIKVLATADPNVWLAMTQEAVWATMDAGLNWTKVFHTGGKEAPRWMSCHRGDLNHLWILTNRQVYRVGAPNLARPAPRRKKRRIWPPEVPTLHQFWVKIKKHNRLYFKDNQKYRDRGPMAALLPNVTLAVTHTQSQDNSTTYDRLYRTLPYRYHYRDQDEGLNWEVMANWDLGRLVFDLRQLPHFGRIQRNLSATRRDIHERVHRLYQEYLRLYLTMKGAPPRDTNTRLHYEIRLQEISAYFDAISGGYWSRTSKGGQK